MQLYRVTGDVAVFGPGAMLALDAGQIAMREGNIEIVEAAGEGRPTPEGRAVVRVLSVQQFKAGEVVGLDRPLSKYLAERVTPVVAGERPPRRRAER